MHSQKYSIEVSTKPENMDKIMAFIEKTTADLENHKAARHLTIVGEEIAMNIFSYAYEEGQGFFSLQIILKPEERKISMEFRDNGKEYNPLKRPDPNTTIDIMERQIGGMGIMLSKKLTDKQTYNRENGQNVFTVIKSY